MAHVAALSHGERGAPRRTVDLQATLRSEDQPYDVAVRDLSVSGFSAEMPCGLAIGDRVTVGIPNIGKRGAYVVRVDGLFCGFVFDQSLNQNAVDEARKVATIRFADFMTALPVGQPGASFPEPELAPWPPVVRALIVTVGALGGWALLGASAIMVSRLI